jgi:hypothetical protein
MHLHNYQFKTPMLGNSNKIIQNIDLYKTINGLKKRKNRQNKIPMLGKLKSQKNQY